MSLRSVYVPDPAFENDRIFIQGEEHRHLVVARAEEDELIEIFDGKGNVWTVAVESVGKRETAGVLKQARQVARDSVDLILALALIRAAAFELALEKAVEVGVTRIVPCAASRSNAVPNRRLDRWARVIVEAAKQSKRYYLPHLDAPKTFNDVLS